VSRFQPVQVSWLSPIRFLFGYPQAGMFHPAGDFRLADVLSGFLSNNAMMR